MNNIVTNTSLKTIWNKENVFLTEEGVKRYQRFLVIYSTTVMQDGWINKRDENRGSGIQIRIVFDCPEIIPLSVLLFLPPRHVLRDPWIHLGITWNHSLLLPIRGPNSRCIHARTHMIGRIIDSSNSHCPTPPEIPADSPLRPVSNTESVRLLRACIWIHATVRHSLTGGEATDSDAKDAPMTHILLLI